MNYSKISNRIADEQIAGIQLIDDELDFQYDQPGGLEVPLKKHRGTKIDVYRTKVNGYRLYAAYQKGSVKKHPELHDILQLLKHGTENPSTKFFIQRTAILMTKFVKPHNIDVVMNVQSKGRLSQEFGKRLAAKLGAKFIPDGIYKLDDRDMKKIPTNLRRETKDVFGLHGDVEGKNILVVDDFVTTRRSFELALDKLLPNQPKDIVFAAVFKS